MDCCVIGVAYNACFPASGCHHLHPDRFFASSFLLQICQFADVVDLTVSTCSAELTRVRYEPFDQFVTGVNEAWRALVNEDSCYQSSERNATKARNQWWFVRALHADFEALHGAMARLNGCTIFARHRPLSTHVRRCQ